MIEQQLLSTHLMPHDRRRVPEIETGSRHVARSARRESARHRWQIGVGLDHQLVLGDRRQAVEIEIAVLADIGDGRLVVRLS